jgi:hypothetical protein
MYTHRHTGPHTYDTEVPVLHVGFSENMKARTDTD